VSRKPYHPNVFGRSKLRPQAPKGHTWIYCDHLAYEAVDGQVDRAEPVATIMLPDEHGANRGKVISFRTSEVPSLNLWTNCPQVFLWEGGGAS